MTWKNNHVLAMLMLVFVAEAPLNIAVASPANGSAEVSQEQISLYLSSDRALIMLRLGSHTPIPVVFDTGASDNVLNLALADQLGLPNIGPSDSTDGQGTPVPGHKVRLADASVSGVKLPKGTALAAAYDLPDEIGILSPNIFSGRLIRISLAKGKATLLSKTSANTPRCLAYPYSHEFSFGDDKSDTLPTAVIDVNGRKIVAEIDTGNNSDIILPTSYIPELPLESAPIVVGYGQSQVGREEFLEGRLSVDITVAGVTLNRPSVLFAAKHKPNIGLNVLKKFTIVLDPASQRDWLIPTGLDPVTCEAKASTP